MDKAKITADIKKALKLHAHDKHTYVQSKQHHSMVGLLNREGTVLAAPVGPGVTAW